MKAPRFNLPRINLTLIMGVLVVLAPLAYLAGRGVIDVVSTTALGVLIGLPLGIYFGALRAAAPSTGAPINTLAMQRDLLAEIAAELNENKALFEARKGSTTLVARLAYITSFWETAKASGRLFVMQDARLMNEISLAYYWLNQANHLESLAYDAKNSGATTDPELTTAKLISEVRLLDEPLETALNAALKAIATVQQ